MADGTTAGSGTAGTGTGGAEFEELGAAAGTDAGAGTPPALAAFWDSVSRVVTSPPLARRRGGPAELPQAYRQTTLATGAGQRDVTGSYLAVCGRCGCMRGSRARYGERHISLLTITFRQHKSRLSSGVVLLSSLSRDLSH
jgi:hypothetical protein